MAEIVAIEIEARFLGSVAKGSGDECWQWTGRKDPKGYGRLYIAPKQIRASRLAYMLFVGPIPPGLHVLHDCDNRACVNPRHLFLGTNQDNCIDRSQKGRNAPTHGALNGKAKLTEADVRAIRAAREPDSALSARYGVAKPTIFKIRHRLRWGHVA